MLDEYIDVLQRVGLKDENEIEELLSLFAIFLLYVTKSIHQIAGSNPKSIKIGEIVGKLYNFKNRNFHNEIIALGRKRKALSEIFTL
jgi:hypothetical protein